jgi:hypothetical protein
MKTLVLTPTLKPDISKLESAYEVFDEFELTYKGKTLYIPKFFQFDGATIPSIAWQIIGTPFDPKFMNGAVAHDWLYYTHKFSDSAASRDECDKLLHDVLIESGINQTKVWLIYEAVRDFGGNHWENRDADIVYLRTLKSKQTDNGLDPAKYNFPANI